jgi:4-hydroxy-tetrahydrodipicolinate synthase
MSGSNLRGAGTALVTPFAQDGQVDDQALRALVNWQIAEGIDFLVPCGSTGEAATMTTAEHRRVVEIVVEETRGRVPVVAGAGSNDTAKAVALSREMQAAGATHLLHVSPMYNKPPQRGILAHFHTIADSTDLPIVVYNVPGRTGSNIESATTLELSAHPNVVAVKEASANLQQIGEIIRGAPAEFTVLSGDDALTLPIMSLGGHGVISVTSNVTPRLVRDIVAACASGNFAAAKSLDARLAQWSAAAFVEPNPIPVKAALATLGRIQNVLRLPLVPLAERHLNSVVKALEAAGVFARE